MWGAKQRGFQTKGCDTRHVVACGGSFEESNWMIFYFWQIWERLAWLFFVSEISKGHSEIPEISGPSKFSRKNARSGSVLVFRGCSQSNKRITAGLFQILPAVYNQTWQWQAPINGHLNGNIIYKWGIFQDTMLDSQTIVKKCSINIPPILHSIQLPIISPPMEKANKISIFYGNQHLNVGWII